MRRRDFISLISGGAAAWPLVARGQQPAEPVIGLLKNTAADASTLQIAAFRRGLNEMGYDESRNVAIDYKYADNRYERLSELAADMVRRRVNLIMAAGDNPARAAKAATASIAVHQSPCGPSRPTARR